MAEAKKNVKWTFYVIPLLCAAVFVIYRPILAPRQFMVHVLPVEKGSAVLLISPSGELVLIDAGGDASVLRALGEALPPWERTIDAVILTSPSTAKASGFADVLRRYHTRVFLRPKARGSDALERKLDEALMFAHVDPVEVGRGTSLTFSGGTVLEVLWPPTTPEPLDIAGGSLVLTLTRDTSSILISDGLPKRAQAWLNRSVLLRTFTMTISSSTPDGIYHLGMARK